MINRFSKRFIYLLTVASFLLLNSCAEIQLKAIPPPSTTAKLRVYVRAISGPFPYQGGAAAWDSSHKEFEARQIDGTEKFLKQIGIYEVVPKEDVKKVLGGQNRSYIEMAKNNWALTREIGKALYAEYVIVIERRAEPDKMSGVEIYLAINLINTSSGKLYEACTRMDKFDSASFERRVEIIKKLYRTVFLSAKQDMFETAIRKSDNMYTQDEEIAVVPKPEPPPIQQAPPSIPEKPIILPEPKLIAVAPKPEVAKPIDAISVKPMHEEVSGKNRLVIYDLEAPEQYRTVALIITEVLREELFLLNRFILVNRENLLDVLREMSLQQIGLIDEKQAVKAGKGLAANQIVTGSLRILGKAYLLNTKRIDVETFATLGIVSSRFAQGEEEDVLSRLPGLAKTLAGAQ